MPFAYLPPQTPVRPVACMICSWAWLTGAPPERAPECPRCKVGIGVRAWRYFQPREVWAGYHDVIAHAGVAK
jgi:hypothetical protein